MSLVLDVALLGIRAARQFNNEVFPQPAERAKQKNQAVSIHAFPVNNNVINVGNLDR